MYHYDYRRSRDYVENMLGMTWLESWVKDADDLFFQMGLTQEQVDCAIMQYSWRVKWLFTPQNYSWWSRVLMALYFLTGYHVTPRRDQNG